ncbi:hypothetical protein [Methylobacter sp.]|uniref:hypothetical protein n=1 Tax=Methylobacter sp. TaxID=2051955 RepID=UPI002489A7F4|nr:hypothetical protein [Methylobacter sp.]MDI1277902.1 hypothetical protein [Methylobacter sp.]MDI1358712.1 hypothetical protein [Methylobacter sp.]
MQEQLPRSKYLSMQVVAWRDGGKLELPTPNSQAGAWELALTKILNLMAVTQSVGTMYFFGAKFRQFPS